ncbi:MAG: hypothetical protein AB7D51_01700 [Desulfovibrionaceae bacterium]
MAAEVLQDFLALLGFKVDEAGAEKFGSALATNATRVAAFGAAVQAMAIGAYAAIYKVAESRSELLTLADAIGVPVQRLEELSYIAEQTGASQDALKSSLQGVTDALGGVTIGQGGIETFHRLGIATRDANGRLRDSADVLLDVGKKLEGMDPAKATMFMGQLGIDRSLLRMLTSDVSGMRQAYTEMYEAVGVDAQQAAEDSRAFVNEIKSLKTMTKMVAEGVAAIFVGRMGADVARLRKLIQENVGKIIPVLKTIIDVVLRIGKVFFGLTARLMSWVGMIVGWFGKLDEGTQQLILGVLGFAAAWKFLNLGFVATPLGAIITGLIALLALIDDFMVWKQGGKSLIDWGPWADDIDAVVDALGVLLGALGQLWGKVKGPLIDTVIAWGGHFLAMVSAIARAVSALVAVIVKLFQGDLSGAFDAVLELVDALWHAVSEAIRQVFDLVGGVGNVVGGAFDWIASGFGLGGGDGEERQGPVLGAPPAMAVAVAGGGGDTNVTAETVIHIDGAKSPQETANAVAGAQGRVNSDLVRHAKGAAR